MQPLKDANNDVSDDDDDYKTLRDVADIHFDFDDVPVRKASLEINDAEEEADATLTREQIADSFTSNAFSTSATADQQHNVTLSRKFRDIDYLELFLVFL